MEKAYTKDYEAHKARARAYYAKNREKVLARQRERRATGDLKEYQKSNRNRKRELVAKLKDGKPCVDCGIEHSWFALDFDHCNGDKLKAVSRMVNHGYSDKQIIAEIEKCELVCATCHRYRTHKESSPLTEK